jgi:hypothetical protein
MHPGLSAHRRYMSGGRCLKNTLTLMDQGDEQLPAGEGPCLPIKHKRGVCDQGSCCIRKGLWEYSGAGHTQIATYPPTWVLLPSVMVITLLQGNNGWETILSQAICCCKAQTKAVPGCAHGMLLNMKELPELLLQLFQSPAHWCHSAGMYSTSPGRRMQTKGAGTSANLQIHLCIHTILP